MTTESVLHIVKRLGPAGRAIIDGLGHRVELAALELSEARDQIASTLVLGVAALVLALLGGIALTFAIAAAVWHLETRWLWLALLTLAYFGGAAALVAAMRKGLRRVRILPETSRQLTEDRLCLGALLHEDKPREKVA
jgi:uncharacterized membrane protein YqjE